VHAACLGHVRWSSASENLVNTPACLQLEHVVHAQAFLQLEHGVNTPTARRALVRSNTVLEPAHTESLARVRKTRAFDNGPGHSSAKDERSPPLGRGGVGVAPVHDVWTNRKCVAGLQHRVPVARDERVGVFA
jgi:hypothetical protein